MLSSIRDRSITGSTVILTLRGLSARFTEDLFVPGRLLFLSNDSYMWSMPLQIRPRPLSAGVSESRSVIMVRLLKVSSCSLPKASDTDAFIMIGLEDVMSDIFSMREAPPFISISVYEKGKRKANKNKSEVNAGRP